MPFWVTNIFWNFHTSFNYCNNCLYFGENLWELWPKKKTFFLGTENVWWNWLLILLLWRHFGANSLSSFINEWQKEQEMVSKLEWCHRWMRLNWVNSIWGLKFSVDFCLSYTLKDISSNHQIIVIDVKLLCLLLRPKLCCTQVIDTQFLLIISLQ